MKEALTRLFVYLFIFFSFTAILNNWATPMHPSNTLANKTAYYLGYYGLGFLFWASIYELIFRGVRWERRRREARAIENQPTAEPVPDTKPLSKE